MKKLLLLLSLFSIFFLACQKQKEPLSEAQRAEIDEFAQDLVESIQSGDYNLLKRVWDVDLFKYRTGLTNDGERYMLKYAFEESYTAHYDQQLAGMVNRVKYNQDEVFVPKVRHFEEHAEIVLAYLDVEGNVQFFLLRMDFRDGVLKLSDFYNYPLNSWESQVIRSEIKVNNRFRAGSAERSAVNKMMADIGRLRSSGNFQAALELLESAPKAYFQIPYFKLLQLHLAYELTDDIYARVLEEQIRNNHGFYIRYLYNDYYQNTDSLKQVFDEFEEETGSTFLVDSLRAGTYYWN